MKIFKDTQPETLVTLENRGWAVVGAKSKRVFVLFFNANTDEEHYGYVAQDAERSAWDYIQFSENQGTKSTMHGDLIAMPVIVQDLEPTSPG